MPQEPSVADDMVDLSIIMPVYNEQATLRTALKQALDVQYPVRAFEIVVVNDGSTDRTRELLAEHEWPQHVRVVHHDLNLGKGAAVRTGVQAARGTYTAILDADLEYDPADIIDMVPPLARGEADAVFGWRGHRAHTSYTFWFVMGGKAVTLAANLLNNSYISDITCCHKAMRTDLLRSLNLQSAGFTIDAEIAATLLKRRARIFEVPVSYRARSHADGKKLTARDGFRVLWTLLRIRFG